MEKTEYMTTGDLRVEQQQIKSGKVEISGDSS